MLTKSARSSLLRTVDFTHAAGHHWALMGVAVEDSASANIEATSFYDTNVVDNNGRYRVTFALLPDLARADYRLGSIADVAELLALDLWFEIPDVAYLPHALASILAAGDPSVVFNQLSEFSDLSTAIGRVDIDPELLRFADYCVVEPVVAIEQSALRKGAVLAALVAAGATVAVAAAPVGGPLILAYFGGSILVGGGALAVVQAAGTWVDKKFPQ
jgi:hypothetical protein